MSRHYSSSDLVAWLRKKLKVEKPYALPLGGWEIWENDFKKSRPVAHFLTETLPDIFEYPAKWTVDPINNVRFHCRNRWATKTHIMKTGLKPGQWYEFETRVMHGLFNELVDFVEVEKANHIVAWAGKETKAKYAMPWWREFWFAHWGEWRCAEAGLDHLRWEITLDDPDMDANQRCDSQAHSARETMILYTWWKEIRSVRSGNAAYEESGYDEFYSRMDALYGDNWRWGGFGSNKTKLTPAEQQEQDQIRERIDALEAEWEQEDEDMMIRLIKLRKSLWT